MKAGDQVKIMSLSCGCYVDTGERGLLIKRTYLAYEKSFAKWDVLIDGRVVTKQESSLRKIN
jgi:hypothetical protein